MPKNKIIGKWNVVPEGIVPNAIIRRKLLSFPTNGGSSAVHFTPRSIKESTEINSNQTLDVKRLLNYTAAKNKITTPFPQGRMHDKDQFYVIHNGTLRNVDVNSYHVTKKLILDDINGKWMPYNITQTSTTKRGTHKHRNCFSSQ